MNEIAAALQKLGVAQTLFVGPVPHWQDDLPKILIRRLWPSLPERTWVGVSRTVNETNQNLKDKFTATSRATYMDVIGLFCNKDGCLTRLGDDAQGDATTWDYGHLTESASAYLAREILVPQILKLSHASPG